MINEKFEEQKKSIENLKKQVKTLQTKNAEIKIDNHNMNTSLKDVNNNLRREREALNDLEQYGRRSMVDIGGIPRREGESTDNTVIQIASKIGVPLTINNIEVSHRISAHKDASIIVKFLSRRTRDAFYKSRKNLKNVRVKDLNIGLNNCDKKIFVNESLTPQNGKLFKKTRELLARHSSHIWTHNGTIFVKQHDKSNKFVIRSIQDILDLELKFKTNIESNNTTNDEDGEH